MRAPGIFFIVLVQGKNGFKGLMTIEANVIVNGHGETSRGAAGGIVTPPEIVGC
jgi:hypothetical protein